MIAEDFGWDDEVFLSFLPASHAYEHTGGQFFPIGLGGADLLFRRAGEARLQHRGGAADDHGRGAAAVRGAAPAHPQAGREAGPAHQLSDAAARSASAPRTMRARCPLWDRPMDFLLERTLRPKIAPRFGGRIKAMVSGGAPLNPEVGIFFHSLGLTLLQGYGQTEAAPVISCNRPERRASRWTRSARRCKNTEVRIAEDGEILVRGELVMQGYWRNEAQTERTLVDGWLHTGDIGHLDEAGPDRHHRPQEGHHRHRQGRQCRAAEGRGHADPAARDRPGDGGRRQAALSGRR